MGTRPAARVWSCSVNVSTGSGRSAAGSQSANELRGTSIRRDRPVSIGSSIWVHKVDGASVAVGIARTYARAARAISRLPKVHRDRSPRTTESRRWKLVGSRGLQLGGGPLACGMKRLTDERRADGCCRAAVVRSRRRVHRTTMPCPGAGSAGDGADLANAQLVMARISRSSCSMSGSPVRECHQSRNSSKSPSTWISSAPSASSRALGDRSSTRLRAVS